MRNRLAGQTKQSSPQNARLQKCPPPLLQQVKRPAGIGTGFLKSSPDHNQLATQLQARRRSATPAPATDSNGSTAKSPQSGSSTQVVQPVRNKETPQQVGQTITVAKNEVIICMSYTESEEKWDSDVESLASDTSTPDFKRGKHELELTKLAIREIESLGEAAPRAKHRPHSLHILADARLGNWPGKDNICLVDYRSGWGFQQWVAALRAEIIRVKTNTTLLYLEKAQDYADVPPIKNGLYSICKVLRQHNPTMRIFIANMLPQVAGSPVKKVESNFVLLQAVCSVNRAMEKIHFLSIHEHFILKSGSVIRPVSEFFMPDNVQLTEYGCMVFRECVLREARLKKYWFE